MNVSSVASGTGRSGSENFLHIEGTGPGNYLWRWTEEYIYAYQPKFSENSSAEWKATFQITRSYIRVPFTYASSLLSESLEQARKVSVCKLHTNRTPHLGIH